MKVEFKIETSQSGKTCGIAIHKAGEEKPFFVVKGCKLANGQNGQFLSGPSTKMDDGKWFNYLFTSKEFGAYISKMAIDAMPQQQQSSQGRSSVDTSEDIPF